MKAACSREWRQRQLLSFPPEWGTANCIIHMQTHGQGVSCSWAGQLTAPGKAGMCQALWPLWQPYVWSNMWEPWTAEKRAPRTPEKDSNLFREIEMHRKHGKIRRKQVRRNSPAQDKKKDNCRPQGKLTESWNWKPLSSWNSHCALNFILSKAVFKSIKLTLF